MRKDKEHFIHVYTHTPKVCKNSMKCFRTALTYITVSRPLLFLGQNVEKLRCKNIV